MEYTLDTKIGQKVYEINLNVRSPESKHNSTSYHSDGCHIEELEIVYQSKYKIALSDDFITLLDRQRKDKRKDSFYSYLDNIKVSIITKETYFPNGIFCRCYSLKNNKSVINKMKKAMLEKIEKEYGFLFSSEIKHQIKNL
jgi:hypothetical protein